MKKLSLILTLTTVFTLCAVFCGCFEQTFVLPSVEGAESVTISSGACRMNVNDSVEKFVRIFEGLNLVEVKKEDIFGKENEKYNAALAELEDAHCVVATFSEEYELKFYFTDDGKVYYFDDETLFASKTTVDSAAVLATAKIGEGVKLIDLINTDELEDRVIFIDSYLGYSSSIFRLIDLDVFLENYIKGMTVTDDPERVAYVQANIGDRAISMNVPKDGFSATIRANDESNDVMVSIFAGETGLVEIKIGDKVYVSVENLFSDDDSIRRNNSHIFTE